MSSKRKKVAKKKDSKLQSSAEKSLKSINSTSTVKTSVVGILNNPSTSILPDIGGVSLFPNSSLVANASIGITGQQTAYIPSVNPLKLTSEILPSSDFLSITNDSIAELASYSPSLSDITGKNIASSFMPSISPGTFLTSTNLPDYKTANREKEEAEKQRKDLNDALSQLREKQDSTATKVDMEKTAKALETLENRLSIADRNEEPQAILLRLPSLMTDFIKLNRTAELDGLETFFQKKSFIWSCGFGHKIVEIRTLPQLKQIIASQMQDVPKKCKHCHTSYLLIIDGQLFTISNEDLKSGHIRGGTKKK